MTMPTASLNFLHPQLMPIVGTPTNSSLKLLTKEVYANARAIPSTCGGGGHGHLGLVMPIAKLLFNSVVLTPGVRCMIGDLKDFYLGTPMPTSDYAYMHIPMAILPQAIIDHYNLTLLIYKGHIYIKI